MNSLFERWSKREPNYNKKYKEIFEALAASGNIDKDEESAIDRAKIFLSNYELYIYAFFLGLYNKMREDSIPGETAKFGYAIANWGKKSEKSIGLDYSEIQKYIFTILITTTELDFIALEKSDEEKDIAEAVKELMNTMESFANGGLQLIHEKLDDPNYFSRSNLAALNLLLKNEDS